MIPAFRPVFWAVGVCWMAVACSSRTPQPFLSDEKTIKIMTDLAVAEAATQGTDGYSKDSLMAVYFAQVFEIHQVSKMEYDSNMRLLVNDLPRLQKCMQAVEKNLTSHLRNADSEN